MDNPASMGMGHDIADVNQLLHGPIQARRSRVMVLAPDFLEGGSLNKLRGVIGFAVRVESDVKNRQNPGMIQLAGDLGFSQETVNYRLGRQPISIQPFHRLMASKIKIPYLPDFTLAALTNPLDQFVLLEEIRSSREPRKDRQPGGTATSCKCFHRLRPTGIKRGGKQTLQTDTKRLVSIQIAATILTRSFLHETFRPDCRQATAPVILKSKYDRPRLCRCFSKQRHQVSDFLADIVFIRSHQLDDLVPKSLRQALSKSMERLLKGVLRHPQDFRRRLL